MKVRVELEVTTTETVIEVIELDPDELTDWLEGRPATSRWITEYLNAGTGSEFSRSTEDAIVDGCADITSVELLP